MLLFSSISWLVKGWGHQICFWEKRWDVVLSRWGNGNQFKRTIYIFTWGTTSKPDFVCPSICRKLCVLVPSFFFAICTLHISEFILFYFSLLSQLIFNLFLSLHFSVVKSLKSHIWLYFEWETMSMSIKQEQPNFHQIWQLLKNNIV